MTDDVSFIVKGTPVPKARARLGRTWAGKRTAYTPKRTAEYEMLVARTAKDAMAGRPLMRGPVELRMAAHLPIPKSWPDEDRARAVAGLIWPTSRADLDNYVKSIKDALNAVVWNDDSQVVVLRASKVYTSCAPRVLVSVYPIDTDGTMA